MEDLKDRWRAQFGEKADASRVLEDLLQRHNEPHRRYHGISHLRALFHLLDRHAPTQADRSLLNAAVWWHDSVYDPRAPARANEAASADLAVRCLQDMKASPAYLATLMALIRATADHWQAPSFGDGDYFMDADIAILGAPPDVYDEYAAGVAAEYAHVGPELFRLGRAAFLEKILAVPRLFKTDAFQTHYRSSARENMRRELTILRVEAPLRR